MDRYNAAFYSFECLFFQYSPHGSTVRLKLLSILGAQRCLANKGFSPAKQNLGKTSRRFINNLKEKIDLSGISKVVNITSTIENVSIDKMATIPNCCGAYVITVQSGKRYVGTSKTVRTRIQSHRVDNDPNVTEEMDKVSVYLTDSLEDADIMECWLIRELKPELNKRHQPDASTWKEVSKDVLLSSITKELKEMFDKLRDNILFLPEVKEKVRKGWITYQISAMKNFCAIIVRKDYLQIDLKVDKSNFSDPNNLSFKIKPTQAWTFNRRIEIRDDKQFDGILKLVMQAYKVMSSKK